MEKRIVLIGAGSAQFGYGTIGDILQSKVLEGSHIVLHDINPNTLAIVEQNAWSRTCQEMSARARTKQAR